MHDHDVSCLAVVSNERLVGIVTKLDFLGANLSVGSQLRRSLSIQFGVKDIDIAPDQARIHDGRV